MDQIEMRKRIFEQAAYLIPRLGLSEENGGIGVRPDTTRVAEVIAAQVDIHGEKILDDDVRCFAIVKKIFSSGRH